MSEVKRGQECFVKRSRLRNAAHPQVNVIVPSRHLVLSMDFVLLLNLLCIFVKDSIGKMHKMFLRGKFTETVISKIGAAIDEGALLK